MRFMRLMWLLCVFCSLSVQAVTIKGRVVGVADGDTVTVLDNGKVQHKIRLAGIDAPERTQDFGNRSKQSLSDLVFAKPVCSGQVISDSLIDFFAVDSRSKALGDTLPSFECSLMLL